MGQAQDGIVGQKETPARGPQSPPILVAYRCLTLTRSTARATRVASEGWQRDLGFIGTV